MSFSEKIKEIDSLKELIDGYGKLRNEVLSKINYKFRLDWNYYSNRMEGNTLTREETKSVMVDNIEVTGKPIKDIMEIKKHDEAIQSVLKMGKGELNISEKRIRELHAAIMYESEEEKKQKIGVWKTQPNEIINYRNEKFDFIPPGEVKEEVHKLLDWLNAESDKIKLRRENALHPVQIAFEFHTRYLTIHPFYDGNGRTARILMNIILIRNGYPPIYIKDTEKEVYYRHLADVQAYGADMKLLFNLMADYVIRSLRIVLNAIEGKEIEEPSDLDKKIALLETELNVVDAENEIRFHYSKETFLTIYSSWITRFITLAIPVIQKFNKFFTDTKHNISIRGSVYQQFVDQPVPEIIGLLNKSISDNIERLDQYPQEFNISTFYGTFKKGGLNTFGCNYSIRITFEQIKYEVFVSEFNEDSNLSKEKKIHERLLHQPLTDEEMVHAVQLLGETIYKHIDHETKKIGLR
jgi:Fic family protein